MMQSLELKIPPPIVAAIVALIMWGVSRFPPSVEVPELVRHILIFVLAATGLGFDFSGLIVFRRAKTTVNPMTPHSASSMITSGVYRVTRNPMYVGLFFLMCAWAVYLSSPWAFLGPVAFAVYIDRFQIRPEERALVALFGEDFLAYKAKVRRWL
ncbi:MAG: isoprenylcysteine carboxylmethyltransferase family protein [Candidatus Competibacteraceae bacterium]|jgi:protein-S-isoprenylcysteine O-methyltransferase Ste14|nr:isoprenylcysteine carboxylmethyltransferase family protein [Candidatus Competibacteraceae bacterium]